MTRALLSMTVEVPEPETKIDPRLPRVEILVLGRVEVADPMTVSFPDERMSPIFNPVALS